MSDGGETDWATVDIDLLDQKCGAILQVLRGQFAYSAFRID